MSELDEDAIPKGDLDAVIGLDGKTIVGYTGQARMTSSSSSTPCRSGTTTANDPLGHRRAASEAAE